VARGPLAGEGSVAPAGREGTMSQTVYRAHAAVAAGQAATLVVCCSASPYLPATLEFVRAHLGLAEGEFFLFAVPGGAQLVLASEYLPKFAWVGQRWMKFFSERLAIRRIVAIGHDECVWYATSHAVPAFLHAVIGTSVEKREREDLARIATVLRELHPGAAVEAYFAAKESDGSVGFTREA
jgi:hypothetical protein